ncbi:Regulation of nuclear pre-mRNA domain-containing protein 1A [Bienertia sinuspersici]
MFNLSQKEQCISFLHLANDILQNSRRKGSEFVNEFWKVLPAALKLVYDTGDESGKKAATRLAGSALWKSPAGSTAAGSKLKKQLGFNDGKKDVWVVYVVLLWEGRNAMEDRSREKIN